jgi:tetratricopeptide (TPR) repeat protein
MYGRKSEIKDDASSIVNHQSSIPILDGVASLVDQSLLRLEEPADAGPRFVMLETIRAYGLERLKEKGEAADTQRRHAGYFLALVEAAQPQLSGPEQVSWLERLEVEHDNLRAALGWAQRSGEVETGLRLGEALWSFWAIRGYYSEGRRWLAALLVLERPVAPAVQAKAIHAAGVLAYAQGDYAAARSLHEEGLAIHQRLDDKRGIAYALNRLGAVAHDQGDYDMARAHWEKSLAIRQGLGDARSIAISNHNLGVLAHKQGDLATARARFEESLRMWRALEDKQNIAGPLYMLGGVARDEGDHESARVCFEESLTLWREVGHRQGVSASLSNLGDLARDKGDYQTAQTLFEESLAISRELEDQPGIAKSLDTLGDVACDRGDYDAARGLYEESLVMWKRLGDKRKVAASLERFVGLVVAQGHPARALRLAGAAAALRETIDAPPPPSEQARLDRRLDTARQALGEEAANHALADGREMTMEQAIACALEGV